MPSHITSRGVLDVSTSNMPIILIKWFTIHIQPRNDVKSNHMANKFCPPF